MDDAQKLEYIVRHYLKLMKSEANVILKDRYEAEDACQESFIKLSRAIGRINDVTTVSARAYVVTTVRNTACDMVRKRNHQIPDDEFYNDASPSVVYDAYPSYAMAMVEEIEELPVIYRDIIHLRCLEKKTPGEIAEELHTNVSTINSRLSRARDMLKRKWNIPDWIFCEA